MSTHDFSTITLHVDLKQSSLERTIFRFNSSYFKSLFYLAFSTMRMFSQKTHICRERKKPIVFKGEKSHSKLGKLISVLNRWLEVGLQRLCFLAGIITGFLLILIIGVPPSSVRLTHTMEEAQNSLLKAQSDEETYVPARAGQSIL